MSRIKEILGFDRFRITDLMFLGFFIAMIFKINYVYQEIFIIRYRALVITLTVTIITLILIAIKNRFIAAIYYLAVSLLMFADVAYNSYFNRYLSVGMIRAFKLLFGVKSSVSNVVKPEFFLIFLDVVLLFALVVTDFIIRKRHRSEETALALIKTRRRKTALFFSRRFTMWTAFFITLLIVINPMNSVLCTSISNQEFMLYHTKDVLEVTGIHSDVNWKKELKGSIMKYDEEKNIPYFGIAKGRNLIVIQIESFMNFLINAKYEGQELTPNLNKLIKDHTIYFDNYYQEVSAGNTSDSEFATNNSIYGTINSYTYSIYEDNYFNGLPWLLKAEGYNTNVFHAYNKDFWNREAAYPALGFDKFYSKKYFVNKEKIGMGLSDEEMFKQSLDIMEKQKQPFYDFFITLSNHYPYIMPYDKFDIKLKKHDDNTTFGYYLNSAHYTDYCIGKFIEDLKERGLYDNSIIAMYGDHTGLTKADLIIKRSMDRYLGKEYDYDVMLNIPLLIHIPNTKEDVTQRISVTGGNLDFMPTVAALMGIDKLNTFYLGHNLLYVKKNLVSNQYYMPKGSFIYGDIVYEMAKDGVFEHGRAYNKKTLKKVELEDCFKYYKKSIAILNASEQVLLKDKLRNKYPHNKNK